MKELAQTRIVEISTLHAEVEAGLRTCLDKAIRIGQLLTEAKGELKHGEFIPWMKENLSFAERTAQRYMTLFNNKDKVLEAGSIGEAYKILEAPKNDTVSDLNEKKLSPIAKGDDIYKRLCVVRNYYELLIKQETIDSSELNNEYIEQMEKYSDDARQLIDPWVEEAKDFFHSGHAASEGEWLSQFEIAGQYANLFPFIEDAINGIIRAIKILETMRAVEKKRKKMETVSDLINE